METENLVENQIIEEPTNEVPQPIINENDSSVANTDDVAKLPIPLETPSKIPRKMKASLNNFETPNIKNSDRRLCDLYMSAQKPPKEEIQTPARKISKKELDSFLRRTEQQDELRKKKQEKLKHQDDVRTSKIMGTSKKMKKSEIENVAKRLSMTPMRQSVNPKSEIPPETPAPNSHVFDRLYLLSTCKKRAYQSEEQENTTVQSCPMSVISNKSSILANKHSIQQIAEEFGDQQFCDLDQMFEHLRNLHIIDDISPEHEVALCTKTIAKCLTADGNYSACQLKEALIELFTTRNPNKFGRLVCSKMTLARANERSVIKVEEPSEDAESIKCAAKMQKETLERLLATKPQIEEEVEEVKPVQTKILSDASKSILAKSERTKSILQLSLEDRNKVLLQKRDEIVSQLKKTIEQEEESEFKAPTNLGYMPDFYEKLPEEKKRRSKKVEDKPEEPSFKPKTNSYQDFQRIKYKFEVSQKPTGWEETVERLRLARIERNRIQESLDIRNSTVPIKKRVSFGALKKKIKKHAEQNKAAVETNSLSEAGAVDSILGI
ncbi:hypothetical protein TVAG_198390 [Trichomonas vaginalis G3]|uniref:Uncharacterized protein n=1 Tax=Trichomonas vaginalis (strain ATCC PRA-98 / G3) TaxID=412133 RepID=A2DDM5_TRIV3|nr:hypothetical protein TVAGG3_0998810 [Trichomonas vaginalis G3]EAY21401.1 hypothetical protein TVAG_198390 [Trichomonas vaginalis G3]KAI5490614.1 hypothetical protein TVAGG3_0998810 [Trichomonas vaginalis G3]|eukprot:XP_001582387.1 hypothetical protein [Trichomonas vaginalis G3]